MASWNFRQAHFQEVGLTQISGDHYFFGIFSSMTNCKTDCRAYSKIYISQDRLTPPSSSLKLIEFETYCIKPNPPLFFLQQNMQWFRNMVHSHFTLCLRACDYIKQLSQHPWYGLWMRVKGPHHYKVTALGSCVKWPLIAYTSQNEAFDIKWLWKIPWKYYFITHLKIAWLHPERERAGHCLNRFYAYFPA